MTSETIQEKKEPNVVSTQPDLRVDFVRHGKPAYTDEETRLALFEGNLTTEGIAQVEKTADDVASRIHPDELVVFWVSPKRRAQQTAEIVHTVFQNHHVSVIDGIRTIQSLKDTTLSPEFSAELDKDPSGQWMQYWTETKDIPEGTETPQEVKKRVERVLTYLERIARHITPTGGRRLHFICVGHEEIFRDLLEEAYQVGTKNNTGPTYGESMSIGIYASEPKTHAVLQLRYQDKDATLVFDTENRTFYKNADPER